MHRVCVLACLVLLVPACGGGSGGGGSTGSSTDALEGVYGYARFVGTEMTAYGNPRTVAETGWGRLESDGLGMWHTTEERYNVEGYVDSVLVTGTTAPYTLDEAHGLGLSINEIGALAADGSCGATMRFSPPGLRVLGKPDGAIVPGDYALFLFQFATGASPPSTDASAWGTLTLNAGGGISNLTFTSNVNGTVGSFGSPPGSHHASTPDGRAQVTLGTLDTEGTVTQGGQVILLAGSSVNGTNTQALLVLVRLTSGATNALFAGDYEGVAVEGRTVAGSAPAWTVRRQTLRADGAGGVQTRTIVSSTDGRYLPGGGSFPPAQVYTVAADGTVQTPTRAGAVSPDGRIVVLAGGVAGGAAPAFGFFTR